MQLILASQSIGRRNILESLKLSFEVIPSTIDEDKILGKTPEETIKLRAKAKGADVVKKLLSPHPSSPLYPTYPLSSQTVVIAADSGVILDGVLYGKPKNKKEAMEILATLSGKTHTFLTALHLARVIRERGSDSAQLPVQPYDNPKNERTPYRHRTSWHEHWRMRNSRQDPRTTKKWSIVDKSRVTFRRLTKSDITRYLSLTDYTRYAGGYTLLGTPQDFVTNVSGSLTNVVGLPLEKLVPILFSVSLL